MCARPVDPPAGGQACALSERPTSSPPPDWDLAAIGDALAGTVESHPDVVLGTGLRVHLGGLPGTNLELFPDAGVVRVATPAVHIALVRQQPPVIESTGIVFSRTTTTDSSRLEIAPDGAVTLTLTPRFVHPSPVRTPEIAHNESVALERSIPQADVNEPASDGGVPSAAVSGNGSDSESTPEPNPRVSLRGRLGAAPHFRTTSRNVLIGRFPLVVSIPDNDITTWHTVVVFGERAARLQADALRQGDLVSVVGYNHERTVTDNEGNERTEMECFAAVISRA